MLLMFISYDFVVLAADVVAVLKKLDFPLPSISFGVVFGNL
jgi:hypothetical protein